MQRKNKILWQVCLNCFLILGLLSPLTPAMLPTAAASPAPVPASPLAITAVLNWCVAGSFQGWDNSSTALFDDGTNGDLVAQDGVFSRDVSIASSGDYEWKAVECGNWGVTRPAANSWFSTSVANQVVKLTLDTRDHSVDAGLMMLPGWDIVNVWGDTLPASFTAVGSFQGWNNADPATALTSLGNGYYRLAYAIPTAGSYIGKIVATGSWRAFGGDGRSTDAGNVNFTTTQDNQLVIFLLNAYTGRLSVTLNGVGATGWCVAGSFQGWDNSSTPLYDDGTHGDLVGGDGVHSLDYMIATAGRQEFKAVKCGDWGTAYPPNNAWFFTSADNQTVKLTLDVNDHKFDQSWPLFPSINIVNVWNDTLPASFTAVGDFQGWNNSDPASQLANLGYGLQMVNYPVANAGLYQGKVVSTGNWDNQFDLYGRNKDSQTLNFNIYQAGDMAQILLDTQQGRLAVVAPPQAGHGQDNIVEAQGLNHNSQDTLYRLPFGAVTPGSEITLRMRAYHNDLTRVRVRFYDTATSREFFKDMSIAASNVSCYDLDLANETCDFWQVKITPTELSTLYYRFIAIDGTAQAFYADDSFKDGGLGAATTDMVDNSYAITVYDSAFQPSPWLQNAVAYQIFPDRFRNGIPSNDPKTTEPRYGYPPTADDQIILKNWGDLPEGYCRNYTNPATPCTEGPRGRDYYGGDLIGIRQRLPYLSALGIKVIYLNPIFEAASNHLYDTQDYSLVDHFFGNNKDFAALAEAAHKRGMKIILDGVFNHVSSDSPYFDRYHHSSVVGACESVDSPYRDWFYFHEVGAGNGVCAGANGPTSTTYDSWYGFDSLPVLNKNTQAVKDLIYVKPDSIARYWLNLGADGWRLDVMPDASFPAGFWQEFRQAVLDTKPDAVIIGELWKKSDVLPFIQGDMADSTMNYRFRNAILGYFGTIDNKGFVDDGQSNQPPSLFAKKLLSVREDYPDATYYTLLNLMDSHDTKRILWSLTPGENNREDKEFNADNLAKGKQMLRLAAVVQMTTPGAPTLYYGDEVGVTGDDDPDDRRTFPWRDQGGQLSAGTEAESAKAQGAAGDLNLLAFYRKLIQLRNTNPVFRTGALSFLLTNDTDRQMAYMMRTADNLAIVAINPTDSAKPIKVEITGLMPQNITLVDALGSGISATGEGNTLLFDLPAYQAVILLPTPGQDLVAPAAPANLQAEPGNGQVTLAWQAVADAAQYIVLRSPLSGGGHVRVALTTDPSYTDTEVVNGQRYYYVVQAIDAAGNYGSLSNEAAATPYFPIGWAGLQWPHSLTHEISVNPTENVYGQVWAPGITDSNGDPASILAQLGYGLQGTDPITWTWKDMAHNAGCSCGNNFEYMANLRPERVGVFDYLVRFSTDGGLHWTYGYWSDGTPGTLTVTPNPDTTPPIAPTNLRATDWSADYIALAWDVVGDAAEYWLYRATASGAYTAPLVKLDASATSYTDSNVDPYTPYFYVVVAVDAALNLSAPSNEVTQSAAPKVVNVTFRVLVPVETPPGDTIFIAGGTAPLEWNPSKFPMTQVGPNLWEITLQFPDGLALEYKYTRGSWERVEWWGTITSVANRHVTINYGATGAQLVDNTATDWGNGSDDTKAVQYWRDPLVTATTPAAGSTVVAPAQVKVNFSRAIQPLSGGDFSTSIVVTKDGNSVTGSVTAPDNTSLIWTPAAALGQGVYTVTVYNLRSDIGGDSVSMQTPYVFTFTVTAPMGLSIARSSYHLGLPVVIRK